MMKIVVKKVGEKPEVREIKGELEDFQEIVGGYIECIPFCKNILCVLNEEGKLLGLPTNFVLQRDDICGNVVFVANGGEDFKGLSEKEIKLLIKVFKHK